MKEAISSTAVASLNPNVLRNMCAVYSRRTQADNCPNAELNGWQLALAPSPRALVGRRPIIRTQAPGPPRLRSAQPTRLLATLRAPPDRRRSARP